MVQGKIAIVEIFFEHLYSLKNHFSKEHNFSLFGALEMLFLNHRRDFFVVTKGIDVAISTENYYKYLSGWL